MTISYFSALTETADRGFICLYAFAHVRYSFRVSTQEEFRVGKRCLVTPLTKKVRFYYQSPSPRAGRGCLFGRPRERGADTEEPGRCPTLFEGALWFFYMPSYLSVKHLGSVQDAELIGIKAFCI